MAAWTLAAVSSACARTQSLVPTIVFKPASPANYTVAHRPASAIRLVVIHVTESSALGAIQWFENPKAQASANYVVSQTGGITEMVPDGDIAWQAGNWAINRESIGVEHGGYTYTKGSFTDAEYRASAQLVAAEMRHYLLPIDRRHIIGHYQVPDPDHPGLFGGFAHHTDPGPYWNWPLYMKYVATYARGGTPAPKVVAAPAAAKAAPKPAAQPTITAHVGANQVHVSSSGLSNGQTVSGFVRWTADVGNSNVKQVDFLVDGRLRWTEKQAPYLYDGDGGGWDTTQETNGLHVLTLCVVAKSGATSGQSIRVNVLNTPFALAATGLTNGERVSGRVPWQVTTSGGDADHVDFLLDGKLVWTEKQAPYVYGGDGATWDTTKLTNGSHTLAMRGVAVDGRVAEASLTVDVENVQAKAPPAPATTGISIGMPGFFDGRVVGGKVPWSAKVTGGKPDHVDFWIDGEWRWADSSAPYTFNGDSGTWDTTQEKPGQHVLTVEAVRSDGYVYDRQTVTVNVQVAVVRQFAALAVVSSIADGATVTGAVPWTATVSGPTPARVEFWIDGTIAHVEHETPYEFGTWDTTRTRNGVHTLVVRAVASDGTVAKATSTVTVANTVAQVAIASQSLANGQVVSGSLDWNVVTSGATPDRVEYWVDGTLQHTEHTAPYDFQWDTTAVADGSHRLLVEAIAGAQTAQATLTITVHNAVASQPLAIASQSLHDGATVSGSQSWTVTTSGPTPDRVEYWVDGTLQHTERTAPYEYAWDTTAVADGSHRLLVKAIAGAQTVQAALTVTVRNAVTQQPLAIASQSLHDGAAVSGSLDWTVTTSGPTPDRVEYWIDGTLRHTELSAPYEFQWDTTTVANGAHQLLVKAIAGTQTVQATLSVTVANASAAPPPSPPASPSATGVAVSSQTLSDGSTISGVVSWAAVVTGDVRRVDFYVGGRRVDSERHSPYAFTLDTTSLRNGTYTLTVQANGRDGTSASASVTVTVANP